jgi:hypothetical protein
MSLVMLVISAVGCDEQLRDVAGPTPNLQPTLASIQREIFSTQDSTGRLACTQCHTSAGRTPSAGLNLIDGQSYQALVGRASSGRSGVTLVVPGDPANSYLLKKLDGSTDIAGVRMPRGAGPFLTAGQLSIIRRWIELGAKND